MNWSNLCFEKDACYAAAPEAPFKQTVMCRDEFWRKFHGFKSAFSEKDHSKHVMLMNMISNKYWTCLSIHWRV